MNVLDLFSGLGGFSLGLERAGMRTVAFCEVNPYCRQVLAKHWPGVPCYDDVRTLTAERLRADALCWLEQYEPPDSRAVSDEFVAMTAVQADLASKECLDIIERALVRHMLAASITTDQRD